MLCGEALAITRLLDLGDYAAARRLVLAKCLCPSVARAIERCRRAAFAAGLSSLADASAWPSRSKQVYRYLIWAGIHRVTGRARFHLRRRRGRSRHSAFVVLSVNDVTNVLLQIANEATVTPRLRPL